jgi:uncharacterized LabA/DUF88 family protein
MDSRQEINKKERVQVYVDGFNLYFGMVEASYKQCKWLDLRLLSENLLKSSQELVGVKYFTSRLNNNPEKQKRQTIYIEALQTTNVDIYFGQYQSDTIKCKSCGIQWPKFNEKMTDVNIATEMLNDTFHDKYDTAMLISGDSDLVPPIRSIHENWNSKRVFVAFPPKRHNQTVADVSKGNLTIGRKKLVDSQFPFHVIKSDGYLLTKPLNWK